MSNRWIVGQLLYTSENEVVKVAAWQDEVGVDDGLVRVTAAKGAKLRIYPAEQLSIVPTTISTKRVRLLPGVLACARAKWEADHA